MATRKRIKNRQNSPEVRRKHREKDRRFFVALAVVFGMFVLGFLLLQSTT